MKQPVKDLEGWFKDSNSGSVDCADTSAYSKYMAGINAEKAKEKQMETLQNEVSDVKSELSEIKTLLLTLANSQS